MLAGLVAYRNGAQHLEPQAGTLARRGSGQFAAARAPRARNGQHSAPAIGGAVKQAPDLGHLAAPTR